MTDANESGIYSIAESQIRLLKKLFSLTDGPTFMFPVIEMETPSSTHAGQRAEDPGRRQGAADKARKMAPALAAANGAATLGGFLGLHPSATGRLREVLMGWRTDVL